MEQANCPCRKIIEASRALFPDKDIDERGLFAWGCPIHDKPSKDKGITYLTS